MDGHVLDEPAADADRLDEYLRPFASTFRRRDQARWFHLYIRGLLHEGPRKTIEAMVRQLQPGADVPIRDLSQALQNFLNQSPWDESLLWRQLRRSALETFTGGPWIGVLDEVSIVKQGQHSVGVHRQYAGDSDRKQNCQVAIVLSAVTPGEIVPLACRLYLPRNWAADPARLQATGVPDGHHAPATRGEVALSLLDEAHADGVRLQTVVAASRYAATQDFRQNLAARTGSFLVAADGDLPVAPPTPVPYGRPNSMPARAFATGHAASSPAAPLYSNHRVHLGEEIGESSQHWLIVQKTGDERNYFLAAGNGDIQSSQAAQMLQHRQQAQTAWQTMKARFGLDHFEGRSWRGFHHHAALVALAYAFHNLERTTDSFSCEVMI